MSWTRGLCVQHESIHHQEQPKDRAKTQKLQSVAMQKLILINCYEVPSI